MKTGAAYIRVSTDDQLEYSPDSQIEKIKEYAVRNDIQIDPQFIFMDEGISGRTAKKRNAFNEMIGLAKTTPRPFDVILIWKFSRFARNQEEAILYKNMLRKKLDIDVISVSEPLIEGPFGQLIERIIEWSDEYYSINLGEEVTRGMTEKAKRGESQTAPAYGYTKKPGEELQICEEEAENVRYIFNAYLAGSTPFAIARRLNDIGARTKRGNTFDNRQIEYILNNPIYKGYVRWTPQKTVSRRIYDDPNTIIVKSTHEPIVSEEIWNKAHEKYIAEKSRKVRKARPADTKKHYLSGILKCGSCGSTLVYSAATHGFQCYKYSHGQCQVSHYINEQKIEKAVLSALTQLSMPGTYISTISPSKKEQTERTLKEKEIERYETMLIRAKDAYLSGFDSLDEYNTTKTRILTEIERVRSEMPEPQPAPTQEDIKRKINNIVDIINSDISVAEKNTIISGSIEKIVFSRPKESISIFFYG